MTTMQTDRARAITTARARPPQRSGRRLKPYLYVLPAALAYIGFSVWPALNTVFYSLTEWDGLNPAVWTGVGAALTVSWAMATGTEPISVLKVIFLVGIVGAVVGLKLVPTGGPAPTSAKTSDRTGPV